MFNLKAIHKKSIFHKAALTTSPLCGCFYCLRMYAPTEVTQWVDRDNQTAVCPHCGIDSVLPSSEVELSAELLEAMHRYWFASGYVKSMVTLEEAMSAKSILEKRLGQPAWLRDIAISEESTDFHFVRVAVLKDKDMPWDAIPQSIGGVAIAVDEVEEKARPR